LFVYLKITQKLSSIKLTKMWMLGIGKEIENNGHISPKLFMNDLGVF